MIFQSTRPLRGATCRIQAKMHRPTRYFNPRAPCGARPKHKPRHQRRVSISIHAPLAGRDAGGHQRGHAGGGISIHAPLAGRDHKRRWKISVFCISIHAPLAGRDFTSRLTYPVDVKDFNPRAPCGARRNVQKVVTVLVTISIHAPLAGRDACSMWNIGHIHISIHAPLAGRDGEVTYWLPLPQPPFQSTRPLRGATQWSRAVFYFQSISIHAPLAGRDFDVDVTVCRKQISIHAPLAGRDSSFILPPLNVNISIHAPLAGRDVTLQSINAGWMTFQSTRPLRGATSVLAFGIPICVSFQSTRPLRGATVAPACQHITLENFNPRAPCGARRWRF